MLTEKELKAVQELQAVRELLGKISYIFDDYPNLSNYAILTTFTLGLLDICHVMKIDARKVVSTALTHYAPLKSWKED